MGSTFLRYDETVNAGNCDREPIHIPGHIQPHGALLALHPEELTILQASQNTAAVFGVPADDLLGQPVGALLPPDGLISLRGCLRAEPLQDSPLLLFTTLIAERGPFHVIGHLHDGLLILEFEAFVRPPAVRPPDFYNQVKKVVARLQAARSVQHLCQIVTEEVRQIGGYDRVMVYKFAKDGSGHVVAESLDPDQGLSPFLDLHYPASDIPAQARALFLLNTLRLLPDAQYPPAPLVPALNPHTGRPLDLSHSFLRGVSPMHTEYLANMGVRASLTLAITSGEALWGLIACHHHTPRHLGYEARTAFEFLSRVVSMQTADKQRHDEADYREHLHAVHDALVKGLSQHADMMAGILASASDVRGFVECGGVALLGGDRCLLLGDTPTEAQVRALCGWLARTHPAQIFSTDALAASFPAAADYAKVASGVLAAPVARPAESYLLWFRPEVTRTVKWGGDPRKPMEVGPLGDRLTPRRSFALWQETVSGRSRPWIDLEVDAARRLRDSLTEVVLRRNEELARLNQELRRSNEELDSFAYIASHDLKEPLRGIYNYSNFLLEDYQHQLQAEGLHQLQTIVRLTGRMQTLIDSLLNFSRIGRNPMLIEAVDLNQLLVLVKELLQGRIHESAARIVVPRPLPVVAADATGLQEVLVNLLANAIKYNRNTPPTVEVGYLHSDEPGFPVALRGYSLCIYVRDDGIGIPAPFHEDVFRIFKRLHGPLEYGGGTGAGLTIVKKIVERHGGLIDLDSSEGGGTTLSFSLAEMPLP